MSSAQSFPEADHKNQKKEQAALYAYENLYEALKYPLTLTRHVSHTRSPENIKLTSMVVRLQAIQHQN